MEYEKDMTFDSITKGRKIISTKKGVKSWVPHLDSSSAIGFFQNNFNPVKYQPGGNGLPLSFHMGMAIVSTSSKNKGQNLKKKAPNSEKDKNDADSDGFGFHGVTLRGKYKLT